MENRRVAYNFKDYTGYEIGFTKVLEYLGNQTWKCLCLKCNNTFSKKAVVIKKANAYSCCRKCSLKKENFSPTKRESLKSNRGRRATTNKNYKGTENISGHQLGHIKHHALKRKLEFSNDVDCEYLQHLLESQSFKCALTGLPIEHDPVRTDYHRKKGNTDKHNTASLDRIDSTKGYIKGNLQWVHKDVQRMKWDLSLDRFIELAKLIAKECE